MNHRFLTLAAIALMAAPIALQAQGASTTNPGTTRREQAVERREAAVARREQAAARRDAALERRAAMTPEQRDAARARRAERASAMPAEQVEFRRDLRTYQLGLREKAAELRAQVKAGTITGDQMAADLKAYRAANRPKNPAVAKPETDTP